MSPLTTGGDTIIYVTDNPPPLMFQSSGNESRGFPIEAHLGLIVGKVSSLVLGAVVIVVVICLMRHNMCRQITEKVNKNSEEINANEEPYRNGGGLHSIG